MATTRIFGGYSLTECGECAARVLKGRLLAGGDIEVSREHTREVWRLDGAWEVPAFYAGECPVPYEARYKRVSIELA